MKLLFREFETCRLLTVMDNGPSHLDNLLGIWMKINIFSTPINYGLFVLR